MGKDKVFGAAFSTLAAGFLGTLLGDAVKFRELGPIVAVIVMGGFIIYYNDTKK